MSTTTTVTSGHLKAIMAMVGPELVWLSGRGRECGVERTREKKRSRRGRRRFRFFPFLGARSRCEQKRQGPECGVKCFFSPLFRLSVRLFDPTARSITSTSSLEKINEANWWDRVATARAKPFKRKTAGCRLDGRGSLSWLVSSVNIVAFLSLGRPARARERPPRHAKSIWRGEKSRERAPMPEGGNDSLSSSSNRSRAAAEKKAKSSHLRERRRLFVGQDAMEKCFSLHRREGDDALFVLYVQDQCRRRLHRVENGSGEPRATMQKQHRLKRKKKLERQTRLCSRLSLTSDVASADAANLDARGRIALRHGCFGMEEKGDLRWQRFADLKERRRRVCVETKG